MLASAGDDIRIWSGDNFDELVKQCETDASKVSSLAWNVNNGLLASSSPGGCAVNVIQFEDGTPCGATVYPVLDETTSLSWHSNSRVMALGCMDGNVRMYDLKNQKTRKTYVGHRSTAVSKVTYNYNDSVLASASVNGEIILHNTVTEITSKLLTTLKLQTIQGLEYSHYHKSVLASVSDDASLVLWDTNARRSVHQFTRSHKAPATDLSFSPSNDKLLMSCGLDKRIVLYDVLSKSLVRTIQVDTPLSSICMNSNGVQIASGTIKGQVLLHDLRQGSDLQHSFTAHRSSVQCIAFQNRISTKKSKGGYDETIPTERSAVTESSLLLHPSSSQSSQHSTGPLTTVDQNRPSSMTVSSSPQQHHDKLQYSSTPNTSISANRPTAAGPSTTPQLNGVVSSASLNTSVFSPDVPVGEGSMSVQSRRGNSSLIQPLANDSVFSPDVQNVSLNSRPPRPSVANGGTPVNQSTSGLLRRPPGRPSPSTAIHPVAQPQSANNINASHAKRNSHMTPQHSVLADSDAAPITSAPKGAVRHIQSTLAQTADVVDSTAAVDETRQGAAAVAADTNQLKTELRQQIKSELVSEIKDMMEDMKEELKQTLMDHHFEMVKQFYLMQVHVETQTSHHSVNRELESENEQLRAEVERLRRTY